MIYKTEAYIGEFRDTEYDGYGGLLEKILIILKMNIRWVYSR